MNRKGQTLGIALVIAITIFIVGMLNVNFIKDEVTRVRDSSNLDCGNTAEFPEGISDGTKLSCLVVDLVVPYFIIIIFSVAGGLITARFLL
tara:strand:- start:1195 stop:1467 length:273 start_codon:yes stop_codon:yes gene_type:complete